MMYLKSAIWAAIAGTVMLSQAANAVIEISAGSDTAAPGATVAIPLVFDCQAGETPEAAQWDVEYDSTLFSNVDVTNCLSDADTNFNSCTEVGDGDGIGVGQDAVRVILLNNPAANVCPDNNGAVGTVSFTLNGGLTPQTIPLVIADIVIDGAPATNLIDGSISVEAPAGQGFYASTPNPGGLLDYGSAVVGNAATPVDVLNVQNLSPDTPFDITAFAGPAVLGFPGTPITVPFGGNVDVNIACTPSARGDNGGSFTVTHDSVNGATSPVSYDFDCAGLSPNVQVPAGPVALNGLVSGADPSDTITVTNPQDGFTSTANNVTATAGAGDAQITVTGGPANIAADDSFDFTVSCDSSVEGSFSRDIDFTWDDPVGPGTDSVTVNCTVSDTAPIYNSDPAPGVTLALSSPFGTESAPDGLDVNNANTNPAADNLTIASATADNAVFSVNVVNNSFAPNVAADGSDDVVVTCTPDGVGTVAGTLTVETNDPAEPVGGFTYPLECTGTGDALTSTPPAGGTLNLGTVPPNTPTGEGSIDFTNNGITGNGSVTVDCTVTDVDDVFTVTPPSPFNFVIAEGGTESAVFQCTPPDVSTFTANVSCAYSGAQTGTADFTVACSGRPLVIPTMSRWGLVVMSLMLLLVAGFAGRRMMA